MRQEPAAFAEKRLVAIFFSLDFFQQLFFRLTLDAEFCKRDGFQSSLTDLYATLRADTIGALGKPRQCFIDGLPAAIAHFHQGNAQLAIEIHEGLIADVACRFKPPLFIFGKGLAQTPLNLFDNFLALPHQHLMEDLAPALPVFAFLSRFFWFGSQGRDGHADRFFEDHNRNALWFARWLCELRPHLGLHYLFLLGGGFCCHDGSYSWGERRIAEKSSAFIARRSRLLQEVV